MEVKRITRSLVSRWWVPLVVGLAGALVAVVIVQQNNSKLKPMFSADAAVEVPITPTEGRQPANSVPEELANALDLAKSVNETELRKETRSVIADTAEGTLVFTALGRTEEDAAAAAEAMRDVYVAADPNFDTGAELAAKLKEADVIQARIDELVPAPVESPTQTPEEIAAEQTKIDLLEARQSAILAAINDIEVAKLETTDKGELADLDSDLEKRQAELEAVLTELGPLQATPVEVDPTADLSLSDQWVYDALTERLTTLQTESAALIVADVTGTAVDLPPSEVTDETPTPIPAWLGLLVGFLAGAMIGAAVLLVRDRIKGVIWHSGDVRNLTVLAEGPATGLAAYGVPEPERLMRKRSVQAIRSAIIGAGAADQGNIVGFAAPISTDPKVLEALAYDVASSLNAVGRRVLMVDLGFTEKDDHGLLKRGGGLSNLFERVSDDEETIRSRASDVIAAADSASFGLDVLVADPDVIEPADILAGRPIEALLEQGRQLYDFVIVIQPTTNASSASGLLGDLQQQIIVCTRGRTTIAEVAAQAVPPGGKARVVVGVALVAPVSRASREDSGFEELAGSYQKEPERVAASSGVVAEPDLARSAMAAKTGTAAPPAGATRPAQAPQPATKPRAKQPAAPSSKRKSSRSSRNEAGGAADRLKALETYSVDESLFVKPEQPEDSA